MAVRTAIYSGIPVWEVQVGQISVVRKQTDHSINLTHFLNVLGVHRQRREEFLAHYQSLPLSHCWVVHGGNPRLKGTWGPFVGVKGLVAELGQQELFSALLDDALAPDLALIAAVPVASTSANAGVPVAPRRVGRPSGTLIVSPGRGAKRRAARISRSDSKSSSELSSLTDSDMSDGGEPHAPQPTPRREGLRQRAFLRHGRRNTGQQAESRKGKEREWMDVDTKPVADEPGMSVSNTSSLDRVEDLLPELLPDKSVLQQLFGPSKLQNLAALAYLRDMKVPKLAPNYYDDSDADESMREITPKDSIALDGVRVQAASSAGSASSQRLAQLPPMPQSPRSLVERAKVDVGAPMNLGQLFDLKLKQREAKIAAASSFPAPRPTVSPMLGVQPTPAATPGPAPAKAEPPPTVVNFRKVQQPGSLAFSSGSLATVASNATLAPSTAILPLAASQAPTLPFGVPVVDSEKTAHAGFFRLSPPVPLVPAADYALAMTRCPTVVSKLPN